MDLLVGDGEGVKCVGLRFDGELIIEDKRGLCREGSDLPFSNVTAPFLFSGDHFEVDEESAEVRYFLTRDEISPSPRNFRRRGIHS